MYKGLDLPNKVGLTLKYKFNFGQMPFLPPPVTDIGACQTRAWA